jgi:hypothetical protein
VIGAKRWTIKTEKSRKVLMAAPTEEPTGLFQARTWLPPARTYPLGTGIRILETRLSEWLVTRDFGL